MEDNNNNQKNNTHIQNFSAYHKLRSQLLTIIRKPGFLEFFSSADACFGYTLENIPLYLNGMLGAMENFIECLDGDCPQKLNVNIDEFFSTPERILAFNISVFNVICLTISNQRNYRKLVWEYINNIIKKSHTDIESGEITIAKSKTKSFLIALNRFSDVMAMHTKLLSGVGSFGKWLSTFMNPFVSLMVTSSVSVVSGQLSQFSVLGREQSFSIFLNGLSSFFESMLVGGAVFAITHYSQHSDAATFFAMLTWFITLIIETMNIAYSEKSLLNSLLSYLNKLKNLCINKDPELEPLLREMANQRKYPPLLIKLLISINTFLGYTSLNAALYLNSILTTFTYLLECLDGTCPQKVSVSIADFFTTLKKKLVFGTSAFGILCLSNANQGSYDGLTREFFINSKILDLEKIENKVKLKPSKNISNTQKLFKGINIFSIGVGTTIKVTATYGGTLLFLNLFMDPTTSLIITTPFNLLFGPLVQFAILGRGKTKMDTFKSYFAAFFEILLVATIVFSVLNYAFHSLDASFYALLAWSVMTILENANVAFFKKSFGGAIKDQVSIEVLKVKNLFHNEKRDSENPETVWASVDGSEPKEEYYKSSSDSSSEEDSSSRNFILGSPIPVPP